MSRALACDWDGLVMRPLDAAAAAREFPRRGRYLLQECAARSGRSHRHYFAALASAWRNLPEDQAARFPSPEHLRKIALIKCGYAKRREIVCASPEEAQRLLGLIEGIDEYALISIIGPVVTVWSASSQSARHMGRDRFQQSKQQVIEFAAGLIGVGADQLAAEGKRGEI